MSEKAEKTEPVKDIPEPESLKEEKMVVLILDYWTDKLYYPTDDGLDSIYFRGISHFNSIGNNTELVYVTRRRVIINLALKDLEMRLSIEDFMRIGNTNIVNIREVLRINKGNGLTILMNNPLLPNGQPNYKEGGEIELDGAPNKKQELEERIAKVSLVIRRR